MHTTSVSTDKTVIHKYAVYHRGHDKPSYWVDADGYHWLINSGGAEAFGRRRNSLRITVTRVWVSWHGSMQMKESYGSTAKHFGRTRKGMNFSRNKTSSTYDHQDYSRV